jgi:Zn-dependent peptidase ImmA (M78 family)
MLVKPSEDPRARARQVLEELKIKAAPVQVEKVAKSLGAVLRFSPLDKELSGMIFIKDGIPVIGINALHHPNRQRFTIAHEIGHLVLHRDRITAAVHVDKQFPVLMRDSVASTGVDSIEVEANQFASELLIPSSMFDLSKIKPSDIDDVEALDELAKKFRVSRQMLEYRIRNLTLL